MKDYSKIIVDYWNNHQNDEKFTSIISASDFYFQEAQSLLMQWQAFEVKDIDSLIQMNYEEFKVSEDPLISQIRELLFKIIAFCDTNAYKGEFYNPERRIIAKAMVRQSNWVKNFIKWRKGNDISSAPSIKNAINYILEPQHNLTMLSENQRRKFSQNVLGKKYEARTFCEDAISFCKGILPSAKVQNESNLTWLYSCLIYSIESEWLTSNVRGVLAKDSGGWQQNLLGQSYCSFGWDEVSDFNDIKGDLRLLIERDGYFPFYNVSNWETNYYGKVVDFADSKDDYKNRVEDWKERAPGQYFGTFEEYGKKGKPKIILLCEKIEEMSERLGQNQFQFYNRLPSVKNMVGFTKILAKKTNEDIMMDNYVAILKNKKNIILQGAPGSGKTYKTPELALSIIGELPTRNAGEDEKSFHKRVMEAYNAKIIKLNKDGSFINPDAQIGFVTFHQSMDYEDFVEGIKPEIVENDNGEDFVNYKICDGIFKAIVQHAKNATSSLENAINNFKKNMNGQKISTVKGHDLTVKIEEDNISVINSNNREYSISDNSLYKEEDYLRKNRWYYELAVKKALGVTQKDTNNKNYVLIIDEINRGNVSKIFGELISLLEADKRVGGDHPLTVTLPYSKESFSVPPNLYIIGTMNTTDRSVGSIDYAVRRRFAFVTLEADRSKIEDENAKKLFDSVKRFLNETKYDMDIEDLMVGHSYFMTSDTAALKMKWQYEILPLLMEYHKDGIIKESPLKAFSEEEAKKVKVDYNLFIKKWPEEESKEAEK